MSEELESAYQTVETAIDYFIAPLLHSRLHEDGIENWRSWKAMYGSMVNAYAHCRTKIVECEKIASSVLYESRRDIEATIAYREFHPKNSVTFLEQSILVLQKARGLFLRLSETPVATKDNAMLIIEKHWRIWSSFGFSKADIENFEVLKRGLKWEAATVAKIQRESSQQNRGAKSARKSKKPQPDHAITAWVKKNYRYHKKDWCGSQWKSKAVTAYMAEEGLFGDVRKRGLAEQLRNNLRKPSNLPWCEQRNLAI